MEAEGTVEIKFKMKDQVKAMHRLDPVVSSCIKRLGDPNLSAEEKKELEKMHHGREHFLAPIYHQVAVHFADLHDTAERMDEKGVVQVGPCFFQLSRSVSACDVNILSTIPGYRALGVSAENSLLAIEEASRRGKHRLHCSRCQAYPLSWTSSGHAPKMVHRGSRIRSGLMFDRNVVEWISLVSISQRNTLSKMHDFLR